MGDSIVRRDGYHRCGGAIDNGVAARSHGCRLMAEVTIPEGGPFDAAPTKCMIPRLGVMESPLQLMTL